MPTIKEIPGEVLRELLRVLYWQLPSTLAWLFMQLLSLKFVRDMMSKTGDFIKNLFNDGFNCKYLATDGHELPRSVVGHIDKRVELMEATRADFPNSSALAKSNADVCAMAMELAYEEPELVKDVVDNVWNKRVNTQAQSNGEPPLLGGFHYHSYYKTSSTDIDTSDTNAYIFTRDKRGSDKEKSAVVLAFRGTEPFCTVDWATDFEYYWVDLKGIGRVHVGFLRALGFGPESINDLNSYLEAATSPNPPGSGKEREPADLPTRILSGKRQLPLYFQLRNVLLPILQNNRDAKLFVTGHSLGGALAALFTALFIAEVPTAQRSQLKALYTFGQPRVGDIAFSWYLHNRLSSSELRFIRILHSNDIVPRVPFDDELFQFKHVGPWFHSTPYNLIKMASSGDQPKLEFLGAYVKAFEQLFLSFFRLFFERDDFKEAPLSIVSRFAALFIPWLVDHSPVNYVNAVRLGLPELEVKRSWLLDFFGKPGVKPHVA